MKITQCMIPGGKQKAAKKKNGAQKKEIVSRMHDRSHGQLEH